MCPPKIVKSTPAAICCKGLLVPAFETTSTIPVERSVIAEALAVAGTSSSLIPTSSK